MEWMHQMKKAVSVVLWTIVSLSGLVAGLAGKMLGWFVMVLAVCFLVAAIRKEDTSGATEIALGIDGSGGCSGCGGCGGCGG
jgi:hypothetical protein